MGLTDIFSLKQRTLNLPNIMLIRLARQGFHRVYMSIVKHIWYGSGGKSPEAPHLYKIGDFYYLMIAEGGTFFTHMVTIARSKTPWGPFESCPRNPILTNMQAKNLEVHCIGHGELACVGVLEFEWQ